MQIQNELDTIFHKIKTIVSDNEILTQLEKDLIKSYLRNAIGIIDGVADNPDIQKELNSQTRAKIERESIKAALADEVLDSDSIVEKEPLVNEEPEVPVSVPVVEVPQNKSNGETHVMPQDNTLVQVLQPTQIRDDHQGLFAGTDSNELSEKLASTPITDLVKAVGINDKLLYINELFRGDADEYADTMDTLNRKPSFEEAKVFLSRHLIDKFGWTDDTRSERAQAFVKLISRRFKT